MSLWILLDVEGNRQKCGNKKYHKRDPEIWTKIFCCMQSFKHSIKIGYPRNTWVKFSSGWGQITQMKLVVFIYMYVFPTSEARMFTLKDFTHLQLWLHIFSFHVTYVTFMLLAKIFWKIRKENQNLGENSIIHRYLQENRKSGKIAAINWAKLSTTLINQTVLCIFSQHNRWVAGGSSNYFHEHQSNAYQKSVDSYFLWRISRNLFSEEEKYLSVLMLQVFQKILQLKFSFHASSNCDSSHCDWDRWITFGQISPIIDRFPGQNMRILILSCASKNFVSDLHYRKGRG